MTYQRLLLAVLLIGTITITCCLSGCTQRVCVPERPTSCASPR